MEHAKLILKAKNDKFEVELQLINTRETIRLSELTFDDDAMNGSEVQVERIMGAVARVKAGNAVLYENPVLASALKQKAGSQKETKSRSSITDRMILDHVEKIQRPAHAPYNFIPLNKTVVEAKDPIPTFDQYHSGRYTGWIELEIETKTPLYIRDTLNQEEMKKAEKAEKEKKQYANPDFFSPGERLRIPGSSLRGMARNMVEIVSFGKFGFFDDKRLYFRGLADKSNLRKEYQQRMSSYDRKTRKSVYKVSAGVLQSPNGIDYEIIPSEGFRPILKKEAKTIIGEDYGIFKFYKLDEGYLVVSGPMPNKKRDWLVEFPKKHTQPIPILQEDVNSYRDDATRAKEVPNLLKLALEPETDEEGTSASQERQKVPCFYVTWIDDLGNLRVSFGHTPMFRLAYEKTIGGHIPEHLRIETWKFNEQRLQWIREDLQHIRENDVLERIMEQVQTLLNKEFCGEEGLRELEEELEKHLKSIGVEPEKRTQYQKIILKHAKVCDLTEAIFGNETIFAGRVFFEDAFLCHGQDNVLMDEGTPCILSTPKPTTFQHYLVQSRDDNRQLNHYNSNGAIRGNKLYWHKSGEDWRQTDQQEIKEHLTQYTKITPIKPGTIFAGHIRFENLSDEELGALLFVLDLPEGCCHKIGMGKPLGLGTVQITPKLYLSKRKKRYTDLFAEWNENITESDKEAADCKQAFEKYVLGKIGETEQESLWNTDRLQELEIMLNYEKGLTRQSRNAYMQITPENEFRNRPVLPKPSEV